MNNSLVIFTRAAAMLAEADTLQKVKELKSLALTAAEWAKRKNMGEAAVQHCRSYALEAERKMGAMLIETERRTRSHDTGGGSKGTKRVPLPDAPETLAELGITKNESSKAQALAAMKPEVFEEVKAGTKSRATARREAAVVKVKAKASLPESKYRILYADPPWKYGDQLTESYGPTKFHYPAMTIAELCAMPVKNIVERDAVLFLWVTSPLLYEAAPIIEAWGFTYKSSFVWDKVKHNMGHYNSMRHEFLLVCTRGSCVPDTKKLFDSVVSIERTKHSQKPVEFREMIDKLYPHGKRLELFARCESDGWDVYGNDPGLG